VAVPLHPDLEALGALVGTWSGSGHGVYPTIEPFDYRETVTFGHVGEPFLSYTQRSTHAVTDLPLHGETGFLRAPRPGWVELVVVHPGGIAEVAEGAIEGNTISVRSTGVVCTPTAKEVTAIERDLLVDGSALRYELRMAAVGVPMDLHLVAELRREDAPPA
jgi:hypothetical protein